MRASLILLSSLLLSSVALAQQPKLVVQITVDQLRADLLYRYQERFVNKHNLKGFNRFLEQGTTFNNTHYRHATTLTAVGHATLATGAIPANSGIIANDWYLPGTTKKIYCAADEDSQLLGADGRSSSPANLTASTFSDQLHFATNGRAKIYSVSTKDRGAVFTGGRFGKAFWYSKDNGNMITSSFYYDKLPDWVDAFNQSGAKDQFLGTKWELMTPENDYHNDSKSQIFQIPPMGFGIKFPHALPKATSPQYYRMLTYTPFADQLTAQFAKDIVTRHGLGEDSVPDYLAISFSTNDYIGHVFGPNSLEAEDGLLHLDRTLADLFHFLDKKIGLENVLLAISADHGVDAIPEYKRSIGFAGLRGDSINKLNAFNAQLQEEFELPEGPIMAIRVPNIYMNNQLLDEQDVSREDVIEKVVAFAANLPSVARVYTQEMLTENPNLDAVGKKVLNNYRSDRSGDIILVQKPSTMFAPFSAASHGSPYKYDTHVPMHFAGWKVRPQKVYRLTSPEDLAVTLSAALHIGYPDQATGSVLNEILGR